MFSNEESLKEEGENWGLIKQESHWGRVEAALRLCKNEVVFCG